MPARELRSLVPLAPLLARGRLGLFSDIDGTLAPIVREPEEARVTARCRHLLQWLTRMSVHVALVTGRPLKSAQEMVSLPGAAYAGNHGLEIYIDGVLEAAGDLERYTAQAREVLAQIMPFADPGVAVEDKGPVLAFHYRQAADEKSAREDILGRLQRSSAGSTFQLHEGRKVIELRPRLAVTKGSAVHLLASRLHLRGAICLGDDLTDLDMFRAMRELEESGIAGVGIAVQSEEAAPELLAAADYFVDGVPGVEQFLGMLAEAISERATSGL